MLVDGERMLNEQLHNVQAVQKGQVPKHFGILHLRIPISKTQLFPFLSVVSLSFAYGVAKI